MVFKIYRSFRFEKEFKKCEKNLRKRIEKIELQLKLNPKTGKILGPLNFREKRFGKYRIYYLIHEKLCSVILVGISEKKNQQNTIDTIRMFSTLFKEELEDLMNK